MKDIVKKFLPHLLIVLIFVFISLIYFHPVLNGKVLSQMDLNHTIGISQEIENYEKEMNETPLWTNSIFGGMPAYQIRVGNQYNIYTPIRRGLRLGLPYTTASILFIYMFGFFLLLISMDINKWLSMIGGIAFGLSSYNIIIIMAGHITKCYAIAYMAPVVAGFLFIFNKKYLLGAVIAAVALGIQISTSHVQIVYYTGILIGLLIVYKLIEMIINKEIPVFGKSFAVALIAVLFAVLPNMMMLNRYYEVAKYSIRGEKYIEAENRGEGLDKDYALAWSYGVGETLTFLIPNAKGGASGYIGQNEKALEKVDMNYQEMIAQQNQYWGDQPFTSGPVYFGAIVLFFFVLGIFIVQDKAKWWLLAGTLVSMILSWGQNFELVTDFFFNYVPFYNKFRTVSMTLVIASVTVPMLAFMAVSEIVKNKETIFEGKNMIGFLSAFGLTGGLALIFWLVPSLTSYLSNQEAMYFGDLAKQSPADAPQINAFIEQLEIARQTIFRADAIRSFLFILFAAVATFLFVKMKEFKKEYLFVALGVLIVADMWTIDQRYLNADMFQSKSRVESEFKASPADEFIMKDIDPNYRVLNITRNVFNDAYTSYFHKSIGGYHGAKLQKYQDVIDYYLAPYVQALQQASQDTTINVEDYVAQMQVLHMLNTKYVIDNPNVTPVLNFNAFGNAWFVDNYKMVETAKTEIEALGENNLARTAIINKQNLKDYKLPELSMSANDSGRIELVSYKPDELVYETNSTKDEFAVFSEIYYPKGWKTFIDGEEVSHINVNYILRGMHIPAGKHKIEFRFEPKSYYSGRIIAIISSILVLLGILALLGKTLYDKHKAGELFPKKEEEPKVEKKPKKKKRRY